jgi:hypothetical protein
MDWLRERKPTGGAASYSWRSDGGRTEYAPGLRCGGRRCSVAGKKFSAGRATAQPVVTVEADLDPKGNRVCSRRGMKPNSRSMKCNCPANPSPA